MTRILVIFIALIVSACSSHSRPAMSKSEALAYAARDVAHRKIDPVEFATPTAEFKDGVWYVFYDGLDTSVIGNHFGYAIGPKMILFIGGE